MAFTPKQETLSQRIAKIRATPLRATPGDIQYLTELYRCDPSQADAIIGMTQVKRTHLRQLFARGRALFGPRMVQLGDQWVDLLDEGPLKATWSPKDDLVWKAQVAGTPAVHWSQPGAGGPAFK